MKELNEYEVKAKEFLAKFETTFKIQYLRTGEYFNNSAKRDIYLCTLIRNGIAFSFEFGDSLFNTQKRRQLIISVKNPPKPSAYDVIACLTKYEPDDNISDFANNFGYDLNTSYREAERVWKAVQKEYEKVYELFSDCMDELREIE